VIPLFSNPEFIRNCRAQLRPGRVLASLAVVTLLCLTLCYALYSNFEGKREWAKSLLLTSLSCQLLVLGLGGGLACGLSIYREKEQNTFDFQRVTRMTPMELALGKLFGAPVYTYFLALCLMPAALVGAAVAHARASFFVTAMVILVLGCVVFHALGLLLSLLSPKGGTGVPGALLLLFLPALLLTGMSENRSGLIDAGPWAGVVFVTEGTWQTQTAVDRTGALYTLSPWTDFIFGRPVHHVPVLIFLYATFLAWILLALVRNLKRDPLDFELYSPAQSVGLLCYLNLVTLAFYRAREWGPQGYMVPAQRTTAFLLFLGMNLALLFMLGMSLLHNREQSRRRVYERGAGNLDWREATWPGGYVLLAAVAVALIVITRFELAPPLPGTLDKYMAAFQVVFLVVGILRDLYYFQWMKLCRFRYPLVSSVVFLAVFYTCSGVVLSTLSDVGTHKLMSLVAAVPIPWVVMGMEQPSWTEGGVLWFAVLAAQLGLCAVFVMLHRRKLAEMAPSTRPAPAQVQAA